MSKRQARIERMKEVELEYQVALVAAEVLKAALRADPSLLTARQLKRAHLELLIARLEPTYFVRLYAEFEAGLRDVWTNHLQGARKKTRPGMEVLINRVASRQRISDDYRRNAHAVRDYRNFLVHEERKQPQPIKLGKACSYLCAFFSLMPQDW